MSGFMSAATALTAYTMENPKVLTEDKLKQFAFHSAGGSQELKAFGWTSIESLTDTQWDFSLPEKGGFMTFSLRVDTKKISSAVLKAHLQEALLKEEAKVRAEGGAFVSRARKRELKELHAAKLLSKAEPIPSTTDIAVDMANGAVYVGSTSKGALDIFEEYMQRSFGEQPLPLSALLAEDGDIHLVTRELFRNVYEAEQVVIYGDGTYRIRMSDAVQVSLAREGETGTVTSKGESQSIDAALLDGLHITKMQLQIEREGAPEDAWVFSLNHDFSFSGLKTPRVEKKDEDDPDAAFLEKLYLLETVVNVMKELVKP